MIPTALALHAALTVELADLLVDRGLNQQAAINARVRSFEQSMSTGVNVTTAREMASAAAARFDQDAANQTGKIDALRARLHHIELTLEYAASAAADS